MPHYEQGQLDLGHLSLRQFDPVPDLQQSLVSHAEASGRDVDLSTGENAFVPGVQSHVRFRAVKDAYDPAAPHSPELDRSYESLRGEVGRQYDHLTAPKEQGGAGVSVEFTKEDPYSDPKAMREDVATNSRLKVFESGDDFVHTHLSRTENNQLRAVHDAYGHLASGRDFSRHGEEGAFQLHRQSFPPEAHAALTSELRGQTSYLIGSGDFSPNVAAETPEWMQTHEGHGRVEPPPVVKDPHTYEQLEMFPNL